MYWEPYRASVSASRHPKQCHLIDRRRSWGLPPSQTAAPLLWQLAQSMLCWLSQKHLLLAYLPQLLVLSGNIFCPSWQEMRNIFCPCLLDREFCKKWVHHRCRLHFEWSFHSLLEHHRLFQMMVFSIGKAPASSIGDATEPGATETCSV